MVLNWRFAASRLFNSFHKWSSGGVITQRVARPQKRPVQATAD